MPTTLAIAGLIAVILAGLGAVAVIIRRLESFDAEAQPLADHFPPPPPREDQ
ncbi:hypothetical protein H7J08_24255 [Mycobacterium frederiksbergense]|uniref:hypothetical protein n=1 Tax=Mycolicibacterium frederiksbergense TaxID=117567 RepID=UPI0021F33864|nr:hypothetical protein [Mycolicibacterium frederiksbergense]MCV7047745.1 hypothetical protein [Mycolicibacterium frederiksbergense]